MDFHKCNVRAANLKDQGSRLLYEKKYFDSLVTYNMALCNTKDNYLKSLLFANRSLVYLELKQYEKCLENIELARNHGYSPDKMKKLMDRKKTCLKAMKTQNPDADLWNFFKLSLPAHSKVPFIAKCLEIKDCKHGRGVCTTQDLNPGDIIAIEEPFLAYQENNFSAFVKCDNCMKSDMLSLLPCSGPCNFTMYCSRNCEEAARNWHEYDCDLPHEKIDAVNVTRNILTKALLFAGNNINNFRQIMESKKRVSVFDFDLSSPNDPDRNFKFLQAFCSLHIRNQSKERQQKLYQIASKALKSSRFKQLNCQDQEVLIDFACLLLSVLTSNHSPLYIAYHNGENPFDLYFDSVFTGAVGVYLFMSLFNHSCSPNAVFVNLDNKMVLMVVRPIPAGSEITFNYHPDCHFFTRDQVYRQNVLKNFGFICTCEACENPQRYRQLEEYQFKKFDGFILSDMIPAHIDNVIGILQKYFKVLKKCKGENPSAESITAVFVIFVQLTVFTGASMIWKKSPKKL